VTRFAVVVGERDRALERAARPPGGEWPRRAPLGRDAVPAARDGKVRRRAREEEDEEDEEEKGRRTEEEEGARTTTTGSHLSHERGGRGEAAAKKTSIPDGDQGESVLRRESVSNQVFLPPFSLPRNSLE